MTVPILNPTGLHSQEFDASVQAVGRRALVVVMEEVPVIGLSRRDAHAVNDATKIASIDASRMVFITTVYGATLGCVSPNHSSHLPTVVRRFGRSSL